MCSRATGRMTSDMALGSVSSLTVRSTRANGEMVTPKARASSLVLPTRSSRGALRTGPSRTVSVRSCSPTESSTKATSRRTQERASVSCTTPMVIVMRANGPEIRDAADVERSLSSTESSYQASSRMIKLTALSNSKIKRAMSSRLNPTLQLLKTSIL